MRIVKVKFPGTSEKRYWYKVSDSMTGEIQVGSTVVVTTTYGQSEVEVVEIIRIADLRSFMLGAGLSTLKLIDRIKVVPKYSAAEADAYNILLRWAKVRGCEGPFVTTMKAISERSPN